MPKEGKETWQRGGILLCARVYEESVEDSDGCLFGRQC